MAERRDAKNRLLNKGEYQKSDGRYMYKYLDPNGKNRFVYSWTLTQSDRTPKGKKAGRCLRELEKEIVENLLYGVDSYKANKLTLNDFFDDYMEQRQELKQSTRSNYKYMYRKFVYDSFGQNKLSDIKYSDVKKFYNFLIRTANLQPNTVDCIHTILHPIFAIAVRDGYIRTNPTAGVLAEIIKASKWERPKRHALTQSQQDAFINFVKNSKTYKHWLPIFTFLLGTGCRIGETIGLRWEDCDFKNDIININHSLLYRRTDGVGKSEFHISTPKTNAGNRDIPMFSFVKDALLNERIRQMKEGFNQSVIEGYKGFVFTNRFNRVFNPPSINRAIERIQRDYNAEEMLLADIEQREPLLLPHFSAHNLRHTFCTRMCENETNLKIIQEIMGHSDITTTMNIYNEATIEKKKETFSALEDKMKIC